MEYLFFTLAGYLSGSVLYAYLLPRLLRGIDIRTLSGDGNPGAANAFQYAGVPVGIAVIVCELLKGFLPVFISTGFVDRDSLLFMSVMAAPVIGHGYPVWQRGEGGKSIAVSFGVLLGLFPEIRPVLLLAFFYLLFSLVFVIQPHFYRSIVTFVLFCAGCFGWMGSCATAFGCTVISAVVIRKHFVRYQGEKFSITPRRLLKNSDGT